MYRNEIIDKMKQLKLFGMAASYDEIATMAYKKRMTGEKLLLTMPVRLRSKKNSPKNPVLCYKDFTQRLNTKGKFGLCRILTHCSPKR